MFGFQFLTTATALLSVVSSVCASHLVDHQQAYSGSLRVNTWVWTGMHRISGTKPTDDEIYSLAILALEDAFEDYHAAKRAGVDMGNCPEPDVLTATLTPDRRIYFSTPMKSVDNKVPFVTRAQTSTNRAAQIVAELLRHCSRRLPPMSVTRLHEHSAACGEISTLYLYATDHADPRTMSHSTDVTIGYNGGNNDIKEPCRKTHEAKTYGCQDVNTAADIRDIKRARHISTRDLRNRMTKLPNPRLQQILDTVPRSGCRRSDDDEGGPACNMTMIAF